MTLRWVRGRSVTACSTFLDENRSTLDASLGFAKVESVQVRPPNLRLQRTRPSSGSCGACPDVVASGKRRRKARRRPRR